MNGLYVRISEKPLGLVFVVGDLDAETAASGSIPCGRRVCKAVREKLEAGRIS